MELEDGNHTGPPAYDPAAGALIEAYRAAGAYRDPPCYNLPGCVEAGTLRIWLGFAVVLVATISYIPIFVPHPFTRDVPWVNLLLFLAGGYWLASGIKKAYGEPERYGGRISGAVAGVLALALFGIFCWGNFVFARRVPSGVTLHRRSIGARFHSYGRQR